MLKFCNQIKFVNVTVYFYEHTIKAHVCKVHVSKHLNQK